MTGDSPPTESDLDEIFSQRPQQTNIQDALKPLEASPEALSIASQNAFGETPQTLTGQQLENFAQFPKEIGQASVEPFVPIPRAEPGGIGANIGMALSPIAAATSMFNPEAGRKIGAGIANVGGDILGGIESPVGLATLGTYGAMSPLVKGIGSLIFGGLMAPGAGQKAGVASVTHDPQDIVEALGAAGMMAAPAAHAIGTVIPEIPGIGVEGGGIGAPITAGDQLRLLSRDIENGRLNFPTAPGPNPPGIAPAANVRLGITGVNPNVLADLPPELVTQALAESQRPDLIGGPISAADRIRGLRTLAPEEIPGQRVLKPEPLPAPGETAVSPAFEGVQVKPGFQRSASDLLLEKSTKEAPRREPGEMTPEEVEAEKERIFNKPGNKWRIQDSEDQAWMDAAIWGETIKEAKAKAQGFKDKWAKEADDAQQAWENFKKNGLGKKESDNRVKDAIANARKNGPSPEFRALFGGIDPKLAGTIPEKVAEFARSLGMEWRPVAAAAAEGKPLYRPPRPAPTAEEFARQQARANVEAGLTAEQPPMEPVPAEPISPEAPGPKPEGIVLSNLQKARLEKAVARGADIATLRNILRLPPDTTGKGVLLRVQQALQGETPLRGETVVKPRPEPPPAPTGLGGIKPFFDRAGELSMMGGESLPPNIEQIRALRALEERKANAPNTRTEPSGGQPEHQGTALGENVRPNEPEVRSGQGAETVNRNRPNEGGPVEPKQIADDLGMRFDKEVMGNWVFTAYDTTGHPGATFITKAGATPREVASKYEQVRAEYGDNPTAPRPLKNAAPAIEPVTQFVSDFESGKRVTTHDAVKTGLAVRSIADLDALLSSRRKVISSVESSVDFTKRLEAETDPAKQQAMITERFTKGFAKNPQYPREAIEAATNTGSHIEGEGKGALETRYGPRPLDWREHPDVMEWLLDHGEEIWPKGEDLKTESLSLKSFKEQVAEFEKGQGASTRAFKEALKTVAPHELRAAIETGPAEPTFEGATPLEPASGVPLSATDALINKLEALKLPNEFKPRSTRVGFFGDIPHPEQVIALGKAAWNGAIEAAIQTIKAGRTVAEAISSAMDYLRYNAKGFDSKNKTQVQQMRANLKAAIERETPKPGAPPIVKPGAVPPPPPPRRASGAPPPPPRPPTTGGVPPPPPPSPARGTFRIEGTETAMRKSAARAAESPQVPPVVQQRIATAPESFHRIQPMPSVADVVNSMTNEALDAVPKESNYYVAARLKKAINLFRAGQMDAGYQVFKDVSQTGTDWGQNINQFKFLKGASPLDIVHIMNKELEGAGKDPLTADQMRRVGDVAQKSIDANKVLEDAKKKWLSDPSDPNAEAAQKAMDIAHQKELDLQRQIAQFKVQNWPRMLKAFAQGNPLTPISQVSNFFGNTLGATMEAGSRSIGSFYDALLSAFTSGRRTLKVQPVAGTIEAAKGYARGLSEAPDIMRAGAGEVVKGETRQGLQPLRAFTKAFAENPEGPTVGGKVPFNERVRLAVEGTFGMAPETMLRMLAAADRPAYEAARARLIAEQLGLHDVPKNMWAFAQRFPELFFTPDIIKQIKDESSHAVFQSKSKTVSFLEKLIKEKTGDWGDLAFTVLVAPYKLTPWNLVGRTLNYNPLIALYRTIVESAKGNRRGAMLNAGRMTVGAMLYGAGVFLYENGLIGPSLDSHDESQKNRLLAGEILPPNHINLSGLIRLRQHGGPQFRKGDSTWDLTRGGGAAGAILASVANIGRDFEKTPQATSGGLVPQLLAGSAFEQANFTINQSFLKGVTGLLDAVQNRNIDPYMNGVENMMLNVPTPNTLTTLSRATRKYMPDLKGDTLAKGFENVVRNRFGFAGADDYLPIKRDLWGEPMLQTPEGRNALLYHFFDISKNKQVSDDPVSLELYDLWRKTAANEVVPSLPARKITSGNVTYPLNAKQYERYAELVGKNRRQIVQEMVLNPAWQNEDDENKVKLLENAYTKGLNNGRAIFIGETPPNQLIARPPKAGFK